MAKLRTINGKPAIDFRIGKLRKRRSFNTIREAKAFLKELEQNKNSHMFVKSPVKLLSLKEAIYKYIDSMTILKSPRTRELELAIFKQFLSVFESEALQDLTLQHLEFYQAKQKQRITARTVNRHFHTIQHFFRKCEQWGMITENPCKWLRQLKDDKQKAIRIYNPGEVKKIMLAAKPWLADVIFLVYRTGLRRKEVASLRFGSVDIDNRVFHIESSENFHPKGYKPRTIPMTNEILEFFRRKQLEAIRRGLAKKNDFVFINFFSQPLDPHLISQEIRRLSKKVGIADLKLHNLRHTFCTNLVMAGENLENVKQLAGHANLRTTEKYFHVKPEHLKSSLENLANFQDNEAVLVPKM